MIPPPRYARPVSAFLHNALAGPLLIRFRAVFLNRARARADLRREHRGFLPRIAHPGRSTELRDTVGALRLPAAGVGFVSGFALEGASQLHDGGHRTVVLADVKRFRITEIVAFCDHVTPEFRTVRPRRIGVHRPEPAALGEGWSRFVTELTPAIAMGVVRNLIHVADGTCVGRPGMRFCAVCGHRTICGGGDSGKKAGFAPCRVGFPEWGLSCEQNPNSTAGRRAGCRGRRARPGPC